MLVWVYFIKVKVRNKNIKKGNLEKGKDLLIYGGKKITLKETSDHKYDKSDYILCNKKLCVDRYIKKVKVKVKVQITDLEGMQTIVEVKVNISVT
jgi:hypothetical protein